jgi:hypothetical protein
MKESLGGKRSTFGEMGDKIKFFNFMQNYEL